MKSVSHLILILHRISQFLFHLLLLFVQLLREPILKQSPSSPNSASKFQLAHLNRQTYTQTLKVTNQIDKQFKAILRLTVFYKRISHSTSTTRPLWHSWKKPRRVFAIFQVGRAIFFVFASAKHAFTACASIVS